MFDTGFAGQTAPLSSPGDTMRPGRHWAMALGLMALLIGIGTAAGGAYVGFGTAARSVALPGGLPAIESEVVALFMFACGGVTTLLGAFSIYKANDV